MPDYFRFVEGPWENAKVPTITREDPLGGDPHILCAISRVHHPDALYELVNLANERLQALEALATTAQPEGSSE